MDNFKIETAQNVTIQQNVASVSTRIGAFLLDLLIMVGYMILTTFIIKLADAEFSNLATVFYILLGLPIFLYSLLFETFMNGQTPGKYFSKIRVTKLDGSKPTFGSFLIRWILRAIDISIASGSVALLTILLNGKGQRLGDIAAGTTVITENVKISIEDTLQTDIEETYTPTFPQVTVLTDKDVQTIKELYRRAKRKGDHKTILKLHSKILELTGIHTEINPVDFIDIVIKDYNYFTQKM